MLAAARGRSTILILIVAVALCLALAWNGQSSASQVAGPYHVSELISVSSNSVQGNDASTIPSISDDGRFVLFSSDASNLDPIDNDSGVAFKEQDVFLRDRFTGTTQMVSLDSAGQAPSDNTSLINASMSGDARYVAFASDQQLTPEVEQGFQRHLFVRDRTDATTTLIDKFNGASGNNEIFGEKISLDGNWITFSSASDNLIADDAQACSDQFGPRNCIDIFIANLLTGQISLITRSSAGVQANDSTSSQIDISRDGRFVVYSSSATNLVAGDNNPFCAAQFHDPECYDVFLFDRVTSQTTLVSRSSQNVQSNQDSVNPTISGDGRYVAYLSYATNLVPNTISPTCDNDGDTTPDTDCPHIFRFDRTTGETVIVDVNLDGEAASGSAGSGLSMNEDGRYVAFSSGARDLLADYDPRCEAEGDGKLVPCGQVYVRDMLTGQTAIVSVSPNPFNEPGNANNNFPDLTPDGREIVFHASSTNLSIDDVVQCQSDFGQCFDIFYADATHTELADVNCDGRPDPLDALALVVDEAGPTPMQYAWCPEIGTMAAFPSTASPQGGVLRLFGDLNCNGIVDLVDAMGVLRFYSYLDFEQPLLCPPLGRLPTTATPVATGANTPTPTPTGVPGSPTVHVTPSPSPTVAPPDNDCVNLDEPLAIPDGNGGYATLTFTFPESHQIAYIMICLNLDHSFVGNLVVTLKHEDSGTTISMVRRIGAPAQTGNCSGHGAGLYVLLDDYESQTLQQHCTNTSTSEFVGDFLPDEAMSAFAGENIHGEWTLVVTDEVPGNTGTIYGAYFYYFYNP